MERVRRKETLLPCEGRCGSDDPISSASLLLDSLSRGVVKSSSRRSKVESDARLGVKKVKDLAELCSSSSSSGSQTTSSWLHTGLYRDLRFGGVVSDEARNSASKRLANRTCSSRVKNPLRTLSGREKNH